MEIYTIEEARFEVKITDQIDFAEGGGKVRRSTGIAVRAMYGELNNSNYSSGREYFFDSQNFEEQEKEIFIEIISMKKSIIDHINKLLL